MKYRKTPYLVSGATLVFYWEYQVPNAAPKFLKKFMPKKEIFRPGKIPKKFLGIFIQRFFGDLVPVQYPKNKILNRVFHSI
jgi:hypothetical protein